MTADSIPDAHDPSPVEITQQSLNATEDPKATRPPEPMAPGDEVPPGSPGSAEGVCPRCGGSGRDPDADRPCEVCEGSGKVLVGIGGG